MNQNNEWREVKRMREERAQANTKAQELRALATRESRDLTPDEARQHDALMVTVSNLGREIDATVIGNASEVRSFTRQDSQGGSSDAFGFPAVRRDDGEVRALRANESFASHVRAKGATDPGIGFGQMIRAMVLGARTDAEKRALAEGTDSAGGITVPDFLFGEVVDRLRPAAVCIAAGARVVPLTSDKNVFAKVLTDPAATWRAENASVNVADATFGAVTFAPKTLGVIVKASRELLEDSININAALETVFANAFASELDRVCLAGASGNGEPVGLANMSGVSSVSMGTNGATPTNYSKLLDAVYSVESNNAKVTGIVANPRTLRTFNGFVDTTNQPLRRPDALANVPFYSTTGVGITDTQGTANNASSIYLGDFSQLWIGLRSQLRVEVLRETFAGNLQYGFLAYLRADVQASHENAFAKVVGNLP